MKKALPFDRRQEKLVWAAACNAIMRELDVSNLHLELGIQGARAVGEFADSDLEMWWDLEISQNGKKELSDNSRMIFEAMVKRILDGGIRDWLEIDWVAELVGILKNDMSQDRKLKCLEVKAVLEDCIPPSSQAMKWFVGFSKEIEKGFMEYLKERMVGGCDPSNEADEKLASLKDLAIV